MDLKLKFRIVALATKYKSMIDFSYINNAINEFCSYNSHVKTLSNIGILDESLIKFKKSIADITGTSTYLESVNSFEMFDSCFNPLCKLLGLNYRVVLKIIEKYLSNMQLFIIDAIKLGCDHHFAYLSAVAYLNYIEIPRRYLKEYLSYVEKL